MPLVWYDDQMGQWSQEYVARSRACGTLSPDGDAFASRMGWQA